MITQTLVIFGYLGITAQPMGKPRAGPCAMHHPQVEPPGLGERLLPHRVSTSVEQIMVDPTDPTHDGCIVKWFMNGHKMVILWLVELSHGS